MINVPPNKYSGTYWLAVKGHTSIQDLQLERPSYSRTPIGCQCQWAFTCSCPAFSDDGPYKHGLPSIQRRINRTYKCAIGVNLANASPCYPSPTHETDDAVASNFEVNDTKQAGDYVAKLRTIYMVPSSD